MKILILNLGSTSFKYRLYDMTNEAVLATGGVERIGSVQARWFIFAGKRQDEGTEAIADHGAAVQRCLQQLAEPRYKALSSPGEVAAMAFKAVHAQGVTGVVRVDNDVLAAMEAYADVAPAHNPPYVRAMRQLAQQFPDVPLVAAFETGFHETIPPARRLYAVPFEWAEQHGIKRWGFHGASHRFIAERTAELLRNTQARVVSCHLGGSSSICAIRAGKSVFCSLGMSPHTGLPHHNRVGDFDPFALPAVMRATGKTLPQLLEDLSQRSGLAGLSGVGGDMRDIEAAINAGNERAKLAFEVFVQAVRHYLGAALLHLGGADAVVFTGGIGVNSPAVRAAVCANLDWFRIALDPPFNTSARAEARIDAMGSQVQVWVVPTNEELILARQAKTFLAPLEGEWGRLVAD